MLSNGFATPIRLKPVPSRCLRNFMLFTHALAVIALLHPSSLELWLRIALILGVFVSGIFHFRKVMRAGCAEWVWLRSGEWQSARDNFKSNWRVQRIFSLTRYFVALRLITPTGQREDVLWFRDQFDAESFRRLRVRLQFYQVEATRPGETI
jgi:hypothetical protein